MNREQYARNFGQALGKVTTLPGGYARLGKGDGSGTILADAAARRVWIFDDQSVSSVPIVAEMNLVAVNNPYMEGVRVRLGYPPYAPGVLHVIGYDAGEGLASLGGVTPEEQQSYQSVAPIAPLRAGANSTADTRIYVNSGAFVKNGRWQYFGGELIDLATTIAALTVNQHQMAVVCLNTITTTLAVLTNTAVTGSDKDIFDAGTLGDILIPASYVVCGAVHLFYGQTAIREDSTRQDFYRDFESRLLIGGVGGLPVSTANVSNPPTLAELTAAFGSPSGVGKGFAAILDDNGAGTANYLVWSDGSNWWHMAGIKAV